MAGAFGLFGPSIVRQALRILTAAIACFPWISQAQNDQPSVKLEESSLRRTAPPVTITDHFELSTAPTTLELAIRSLGKEIDQKRAEEAVQSPLETLWQATFWRYIPIGGTTATGATGVIPSEYLVTQGDPFFVPNYLKFEMRQCDRELAASERRSLLLFER